MVKRPTTPKSRGYSTLIIIHVSGCFGFSDINISQGSVATHLRCGGIFYYALLGIYC